MNRRWIAPAALAGLLVAGSGLALPGQAQAVETKVDPCSVLTVQAADKLRGAFGYLLPSKASALPNWALVLGARVTAGCSGADGPTVSPAELQNRLCSIATVANLDNLADRVKASSQAKAKITEARVAQARTVLHCDTPPASKGSAATTTADAPPVEGGTYYADCAAARAAGAAPIHRGQPGYRPALDRDNDGIACETGDASSDGSASTDSAASTDTPSAAASSSSASSSDSSEPSSDIVVIHVPTGSIATGWA